MWYSSLELFPCIYWNVHMVISLQKLPSSNNQCASLSGKRSYYELVFTSCFVSFYCQLCLKLNIKNWGSFQCKLCSKRLLFKHAWNLFSRRKNLLSIVHIVANWGIYSSIGKLYRTGNTMICYFSDMHNSIWIK